MRRQTPTPPLLTDISVNHRLILIRFGHDFPKRVDDERVAVLGVSAIAHPYILTEL